MIIGITIALSSSVFAQPDWYLQQSGTFQDLKSVFFTAPGTGYAAGYNGIILYTDNGGQDWGPQTSGVTSPLMGISFSDVNNGVAGGMSGTIVKTVNGGQNWEVIQDGWMITYYSAFQLDSQNSFVGGVNTIFQALLTKTTNGWSSMNSYNFYATQGPVSYECNIQDIYFLDAQHGFAALKIFNGEGAIMGTANGGQNWTTVQWSDNAFMSIDFPDSLTGYAVGLNGCIYKTVNGGINWTLLTSGTTYNLNSVCFVDADNGWAVGDDAIIIRTQNGGTSWEEEEPNAFTNFTGVHFYDIDNGYIVGENGVILKRGEQAIPNVTVTLTPGSDPVIIPAQGGSFDFNIAVSNNDPDPVNIDVWTMVTFPNGQLYGPIINVNTTIPLMTTLDRDRTQNVPAGAMSGTYFYSALVGDYPFGEIAEDYFEVLKLGNDSGTPQEGWFNWGEEFDESLEYVSIEIPADFSVISVYPNPFNPSTEFSFNLHQGGMTTLTIYDINGREAVKLVDNLLPAGVHQVEWNAAGMPSGMYFARLSSGGEVQTVKCLLVK